MSANRHDLISQMNTITSELLREKGYISFVDLLIRMGKLSQKDYEDWRNRKVPYLEKVVTVNLAKIGVILRALHANSTNGGLRTSHTVYLSWGKGKKTPLRFSKSGDHNVERAWATHFLLPQKRAGENKIVTSDRDNLVEIVPIEDLQLLEELEDQLDVAAAKAAMAESTERVS